ncbi:MAG TPA: hypothetical protein VLH86_04930 [Patescibacteria group bacterium]|nr:hypothetical protein [Patescibacteria group bacterium]
MRTMSELTVLPPANAEGIDLQIYTESNYYDVLSDRIAATTAGDRVVVTTMGFDPTEPKVAQVMDEMYSAAERRVDVQLGVDAYTFLLDDKNMQLGPLLTRDGLEGKMGPAFRERLDSIQQLGSYTTGRASIINVPSRHLTVPIAGRSHIKGAVVNDWSAVGGCNLFFTEKLDMMVGGEDVATANLVHGIMSGIIQAKDVRAALGNRDLTFPIDRNTDLVVDVGNRNQSLIAERAAQTVREADEWALLSCQYFPAGEPAKWLTEALARGVQADALFNAPSKHGLISGTWQRLTILGAKMHVPGRLLEGELPSTTPLMHDKVLATNIGGAVGTHNYIDTGVKVGTAEMTLFRRDPAFGHAIANALLRQVGLVEDPRFAHITRPLQ